jgi:hypothetical protein
VEHIYHQAGDGHECNEFSCSYCELAVCRICGLFEGSLTTDCPGERVKCELSDKIYSEKLDYRVDEGGWVNKLSPVQQSAVRARIFDHYAGRSSLSEREIMLKFGVSKEEYYEIRSSCLKYLYK